MQILDILTLKYYIKITYIRSIGNKYTYIMDIYIENNCIYSINAI